MLSLLVFKFTACLDSLFGTENLALVLHLFYIFITITTQNQYSCRRYSFKMEPGVQAPLLYFWGWIQRIPRTTEKRDFISQAKCYLLCFKRHLSLKTLFCFCCPLNPFRSFRVAGIANQYDEKGVKDV